jgi:hypothetical protein
METPEYKARLKRSLQIMAEIEAHGMLAMMKHKTELMKLAPMVLKEAAKREGLENG